MRSTTKGPRSRARAGRTEKVSVSIDRAALAALRRRAKQLYDGNLSAAIAEGARRIREQEEREAVVAWLGPAANVTAEERDSIRAEWRDPEKGHKRHRRRVA